MKAWMAPILPILDLAMAPLVLPAAILLKSVRKLGVQRMPACKRVLMGAGVFPIRNHYYEPFFDARELTRPLDQERNLPGIDFNLPGQTALLARLRFGGELQGIPDHKIDDLTFHFGNGAFDAGDAEFLYNLIRLMKPARILEIGSGHSTLMAIKAVAKNREENPAYACRHTCIEPFEMPWLEKSGVEVVRRRVEEVDQSAFRALEPNDILFIDSSHMIRPQGDVLCEYLELLPILGPGVIVHIHDIFTPRDYPEPWIKDSVRFWNEQYLLEAFLSCNREWKVIAALNQLKHAHPDKLAGVCPYLGRDDEPGSFYMQKAP